MSGWKSKLAAALSIVYGVAGVLLGMHDLSGMMDYIITGVGLLGVAHKIEKTGEVWRRAYDDDLQTIVNRNSDNNP